MQLISLCIFFSRKPTRMRRGKCIEKKKWEQISWFGSGNVVKKKEKKKEQIFWFGLFCFLFFPIEHCYIQFFFFEKPYKDFIKLQQKITVIQNKRHNITMDVL